MTGLGQILLRTAQQPKNLLHYRLINKEIENNYAGNWMDYSGSGR